MHCADGAVWGGLSVGLSFGGRDDIGVSSGYETAINSVPLAGKASARLATSFPPRCLFILSILPVKYPPILYTIKGGVLDLLNRCMPRIRISLLGLV